MCFNKWWNYCCPIMPTPHGRYGMTPLHEAVTAGSSKITNLLLQAGCPVDSRENDGLTPVFLAVQDNKISCLDALLKHLKYIGICYFFSGILLFITCLFKGFVTFV